HRSGRGVPRMPRSPLRHAREGPGGEDRREQPGRGRPRRDRLPGPLQDADRHRLSGTGRARVRDQFQGPAARDDRVDGVHARCAGRGGELMKPRTRWLLVALALAGVAFAASSTFMHYRLLTDPKYVTPCDINATFNCTQAYLSRFGSVFGVPVAIGGVAWFALIALIAASARPPVSGASSPVASYVFVLATIALACVLRLAYASYVVLNVVCLLCLGTYVCVLGIFVVSAMTTSFPLVRVPRRLLGDLRSLAARPLLLVIAVLYFGGVATAVALFPREMQTQTAQTAEVSALPQEEQSRFAAAWAQQPRVNVGIPAAGAKIVIVKFQDWLCPTCKYFH